MNFRRDIWDVVEKLGLVSASTIPIPEPKFIMQIERARNGHYSRRWFYLDNAGQKFYSNNPDKLGPYREDLNDDSDLIRSVIRMNNPSILKRLDADKTNGILMESESFEVPEDDF